MSKVRWGLLSTANINRRLIPAIHATQRGVLVAVASRSQAGAEQYAAKWQISQAFGSYQAMLDSGAIDAVYISLPNHLHAEWAVRAMRAGLHVLCEKPFALSLAEVDEMIETSQATGRVLAEAFMYRHHPQTKIVGQWVQDGRLGNLTMVRGVFNFAFQSRDNIRLVPELGGGSLWDVGVYPLSLAQFIMGSPPEWVIGDQWLGSSGVDEVFAGQMHYSNGRMAQIASAFRTPIYTSAEIWGTGGRLIISRPFVGLAEGQITFYPAEGQAQEIPVPEEDLYLGEVRDMHAAILDGKASYLSLTETRNHVKTVLALYRSAQEGRRVHLEEIA